MTPPNIAFLFADQLQAFALRCMGNRDIHTPNLDALAADGVLFRQAYSDSPVCTPYRGCLMTGLYPTQSGIRNNENGPRPGERCLAHGLRDAGYVTSYVGKWHLHASGNVPIAPEHRAGFEHFVGYQCYNSFIDNVTFFDEAGEPRTYPCHRTIATTDLAIKRLAAIQDQERPFALFVSYQNPHYPIEPDPAFAALYAQAKLQTRPNVDLATSPFTPTYSPFSPRPIERDPNFQRYGRDLREFHRLYYALVTQLDHEIGRFIRYLKNHDLYDQTLIIFTSDHGEMMGSHGHMNKGLPHEESARVPLIARLPEGQRGGLVDTPVSAGIDIWPTLAAAAGYNEGKALAGHSWLEFLQPENPANSPTRTAPVFAEHPWPGHLKDAMPGPAWAMVREGDWKLVADRETLQPISLHHLAQDPGELTNLIDSHHEKINELTRHLRSWQEKVGLAGGAEAS